VPEQRVPARHGRHSAAFLRRFIVSSRALRSRSGVAAHEQAGAGPHVNRLS